MTRPTDEARDVKHGRTRALLVGFVVLAGLAALVAVLSAESPSRETETVQATEAPGAASTAEAPSEHGGDQPTSTPPSTASEEASAATTTPRVDSSEELSTTPPEAQPDAGIEADLQAVLDSLTTGLDTEAVARLSQSGDLRIAWVIADLMRFIHPEASGLRFAFTDLTGIELGWNPWLDATNKLMEWGYTGAARVRRMEGRHVHPGGAGMGPFLHGTRTP